jgi:hypothetical protein
MANDMIPAAKNCNSEESAEPICTRDTQDVLQRKRTGLEKLTRVKLSTSHQSAAPGLGVQVLPIRTTMKKNEEEEEREVRTCELKNSDNLCVSIPMSPCTFPWHHFVCSNKSHVLLKFCLSIGTIVDFHANSLHLFIWVV